MADGPDVIPLMRGGPLQKTVGCLVLLLLIMLELVVAGTVCYYFYQWAEWRGMVSPGAPDAGVLFLVAPFAGFVVWGFDRMLKALVGISPFRILWEIMKLIP